MASNVNEIVGHNPEDELDERIAMIDKLPDECLLSIFDHLNKKDLLVLSLVSKRFNGLTDRSFRFRIAKIDVTIKKLPSLKLQKFGSSISSLNLFAFDVNEEIMAEICELCPNLNILCVEKMSAQIFIKPFFRTTLSQLKILIIYGHLQMAGTPTPNYRNAFKSALQCCENLTRLRLGRYEHDEPSNFEPFLQVIFPKLRHFHIGLDGISSPELFAPFLQLNTTIKSLLIEQLRLDVDLSVILTLERLERLTLNVRQSPQLSSILANLFQLNQLQYFMIVAPYTRRTFEAFFKSLKKFQNLTEIKLELGHPTDSTTDLLDIRNEDLIQLKYLPNLEMFDIDGMVSYVTLPCILEIIKKCTKLKTFIINGFRQNFSPDESILLDEDIYEKFSQSYFEKKQKNVKAYFIKEKSQRYKWFHIDFGNHIDLYKRCLE